LRGRSARSASSVVSAHSVAVAVLCVLSVPPRPLRSRQSQLLLPAALEELYGALVLLRRRARLERTEVAPLPRLGILLARVQPILARLQFPNHGLLASL